MYIKLLTYRWYHENGSFSVNSFNEHYLSISQYTTQVAEGTVFRKHMVCNPNNIVTGFSSMAVNVQFLDKLVSHLCCCE